MKSAVSVILVKAMLCFCLPVLFASAGFSQQKSGVDSIRLYSVPGKNRLQVKIMAAEDVRTTFVVVDAAGSLSLTKVAKLNKGANTVYINLGTLGPGNYFLRIVQPGRSRVEKFVIGATRSQN